MIEALKFIVMWGCFIIPLFIAACLLGHFLKTRTKAGPDPIEHVPEGWE